MRKTKRPTAKRRVWCIIGVILLVWCIGSLIVTKCVYDSIFKRYEPMEIVTVPSALTDLVAARQTVTYTVEDCQLTGYVYTPSQPTVEALMVIVPGFHACADEYLWQIDSFLQKGWTVFTFDPTGSCHSEGASAVGFPQERIDLEGTLSYLDEQDGFGYEQYVLIGHSRGGYAACCAVEGEDNIAAVVSIAGVNSAMEGVMSTSVKTIGPIAYGNYPFLWLYQTMLFGDEVANCSAATVLSETDIPALLVQGLEDDVIPADKYSVASHIEEIDSPNVQCLLCEKDGQSGHIDLLFDEDGSANEDLMEQIHRFCLQHIG